MNICESMKDATPEEIKRLRIKANLTQKATADLFGLSLSSWQRKEIPKKSINYRSVTTGELWVLLLLADEHPDYVLTKREA